jgi:hypothetical protein
MIFRGQLHVEKLRPLRPARQILEELRGNGDLAAASRLTTHEGEYAVVATVRGDPERAIGIIYGDDFYVLLQASDEDGAPGSATAAIRTAVVELSLRLPPDRPRPFCYRGPPTWRRVQIGQACAWYPPTFLERTSMIEVWPARPTTGAGLADRARDLLPAATFAITAPRMVCELRTASGMAGALAVADERAPGHGRTVHAIALGDDRYVYAIRAELDPRHAVADRDLISDLVESIEPLPHPRSVQPDSISWMAE